MSETIHDLSLLLGQLKAQIDYLTIDARYANQARRATYLKLDMILKQISTAEHHIDNLQKRLNAVEQPMKDIQRWQERGLGAVMLIGLVFALIGGAIASSWQKILSLLRI